MLSCKQITELVTESAEGGLSFGGRMRFQLYIGMCRNCRRYVRQVKPASQAVQKVPPPEMPADLEGELMRRFEGWKATRK